MKKIFTALFLIISLSVVAFCAETVMFDFGKESDGCFGMTQKSLENLVYDNESVSWTNATPSHSGLETKLTSYNIDGIDYKYVVTRIKVENDVNTASSNFRLYFGRVDKITGNKTRHYRI